MVLPASLQALDEQLLLAVHGAPAVLVPLFVVATVIGGGWGLLALLPFGARASTRRATLWLFAAIVAQSALVSSIKLAVGRARPCDVLGWCAPIAIHSPGGASFPSGHAAGAFAFASFVSVRAPRWAVPALVWAALTAWSRCVLGVHYPSDVAAGALLGATVGSAFAWASLKREPSRT